MSKSLKAAQAYAWYLARILMVCTIVFKVDDLFCVMPSSEWDGDPESVVHEFDPFAI